MKITEKFLFLDDTGEVVLDAIDRKLINEIGEERAKRFSDLSESYTIEDFVNDTQESILSYIEKKCQFDLESIPKSEEPKLAYIFLKETESLFHENDYDIEKVKECIGDYLLDV